MASPISAKFPFIIFIKWFRARIDSIKETNYFLIGAIFLIFAGYSLAAEASLSWTSQLKVGLIFADDLKAYTEVLYFPMTSYPEFKIGQSVQESLRMALASLYPGVEEIDREPVKGEHDCVLRIGVNRKKCGLRSIAPLSSYASPEFD